MYDKYRRNKKIMNKLYLNFKNKNICFFLFYQLLICICYRPKPCQRNGDPTKIREITVHRVLLLLNISLRAICLEFVCLTPIRTSRKTSWPTRCLNRPRITGLRLR